LGVALLILGGAGSRSYAETVQEAGIPGAVQFEAVFPNPVWGNFEGLYHRTELVLINNTAEDINFELQVFWPDGTPGSDFLEWGDHYDGPTWPDGKTSGWVQANSVITWERDYDNVKESFFQGWGILRANGDLQAFARLTVMDLSDWNSIKTLTVLDQTANYRGVRFATYSVYPRRQQTYGSFWDSTTLAVALVNPGDRPMTVNLKVTSETWEEEEAKHLVLLPKAQELFLITNLFDVFSLNPGYRGTLEVSSEDGEFSITAFELQVNTKENGGSCYPSKCHTPYKYNPHRVRELKFGEQFNFPEAILFETVLDGFQLRLTRFGLIVLDDTGEVHGIHPLYYDSERSYSPGFIHAPEYGFAFVSGIWNTAIIFATSGKVAIAKHRSNTGYSESRPVLIEQLETPGHVQISQDRPCWAPIIVVDVIEEKIISVSSNSCL
jgi:hypothetical protein